MEGHFLLRLSLKGNKGQTTKGTCVRFLGSQKCRWKKLPAWGPPDTPAGRQTPPGAPRVSGEGPAVLPSSCPGQPFSAWPLRGPMSRSFWTIQRPRSPSLTLKSISRSYFLLGLKPDSVCDHDENSVLARVSGFNVWIRVRVHFGTRFLAQCMDQCQDSVCHQNKGLLYVNDQDSVCAQVRVQSLIKIRVQSMD